MAVRVIPATVNSSTNSKNSPELTDVAAYCRVSTELEEQGSSYEAQVAHYNSVIAENPDWRLAGIYADEGITGTSTRKREEFNRMIQDCLNGKIDLVLTKSISRFARNTVDCLENIRILKDIGIPVRFEKESIDTMDGRGELLITILASLAQQESASISQNVRMGINYMFQQGKPRVNCERFLGFTKQRGGQLEIVPDQADLVRRIYRDFLEGMTYNEIVNELNEEKIPTIAGGSQWFVSTIRSILTNEKYMGDLLLQKSYTVDFLTKKREKNNGKYPQYYVENAHPPIVPKEIFYRVQGEILRRSQEHGIVGNKKRTTMNMPLNRVITCGKCGSVYKRYTQGEKHIWRCRARYEQGKRCDAPPVDEKDVEQAVVDAFHKLPRYMETLIRMHERLLCGPLEKLTVQVNSLEIRKKELTEILKNGTADEVEAAEAELEQIEPEYIAAITEKAEHSLQEAQIYALLRLMDDQKEMKEQSDPACYIVHDFYERTKDKELNWPIEGYDPKLVRRFISQIVVFEDNIEVELKAGIKISCMC